MSVIKITAQILESQGWTDGQVEDYFKTLNQKQKRGSETLSARQRRLLRDGRTAAEAYNKGLKKAAGGKMELTDKKHYRWLSFENDLLTKYTKLEADEVSFDVIFNDEMLKSLRKLAPTLDTKDTNQRHKFNRIKDELRDFAAAFGRVADIDNKQIVTELSSEFAEDWKRTWSDWRQMRDAIAISKADEEALREEIAAEIDLLAPNVWVSIRA